MKLEWNDYLGNRLIADHPDGFKIILPKCRKSESRPLFCPVCDSLFTSYYDDEAWKKFQCCDTCATRWAYPDPDRWSSGWRPSKDDLTSKKTVSPI